MPYNNGIPKHERYLYGLDILIFLIRRQYIISDNKRLLHTIAL